MVLLLEALVSVQAVWAERCRADPVLASGQLSALVHLPNLRHHHQAMAAHRVPIPISAVAVARVSWGQTFPRQVSSSGRYQSIGRATEKRRLRRQRGALWILWTRLHHQADRKNRAAVALKLVGAAARGQSRLFTQLRPSLGYDFAYGLDRK